MSKPWKNVIFPALRIIVFAVIAVALVKLAFFPANTLEAADVYDPGGELIEPTALVETGNISNDIELTGSIVRDESKPVLATTSGEIGTIFVAEGDTVRVGAPLYQIRTEHEPTQVENEEPAEPYFTYTDVYAPATGTLTEFPFLVGMGVDIGSETGKIQPDSFHLQAPLTAAQQYRFTDAPTAATITITDGPAPFECTNITIEQAESATEGESASGVAVRCPIPEDIQVFAGLAATVSVAGGSAEDVLVLPISAVLGTTDSGMVYLTDETEVPVKLGLSDAEFVEIISGLEEGDEVLLYAPGKETEIDCDDPESYDPMFCGELLP